MRPEREHKLQNSLQNRSRKIGSALERAKGIEPSTYSLGSCRSTTELRPHLPRSCRITRMRGWEKPRFAVAARVLYAAQARCRRAGVATSGDGASDRAREAKDAQSLALVLGVMRPPRWRGFGAGAGPLLLSRPADPVRGGVCARRGNRHLCPPDHARAGRGARPV